MEFGRVVGLTSVLVPNLYNVALSPEDFSAFAPIRASIEQEMAQYLRKFALERGYATTGPPEVHIVCDTVLRPGRIVAIGEMTEPPEQPEPPTDRLPQTRLMPRVTGDIPPHSIGDAGEAHLALGDITYPLNGNDIALGRGLENTIVFEDRRVSRSHARLTRSGGHWIVRDEGSTNGTFVNGRMVTQHALKEGDRLSLGGLELLFHQRWEGA
jgi:hypothetical protein